MYLNKGKIIRKEVAGTRCSVVEMECNENRAGFLKKLLEHNGYEVLIQEELATAEPEVDKSFTVGVTDITFNAVVAVYQRRLRTFSGKRVTPGYWNQMTEDIDPWYWRIGRAD